MQYKLVGNKYNEMHALLKWILDSSPPERSNKGPEIMLKGDQKDKIVNIEKNNAVGVLQLHQYLT
jgi:hypothetical protein